MSDIQFDSDLENNPHYARAQGIGPMNAGNNNASNSSAQSGSSRVGMINWLIRHGILRGESSAKVFLIGFISLNFIATAVIMYFFVFR